MHQHFVDNNLEKDWRDKRENLQKERGNDDFAQHPPIFEKRPNKPSKIKLLSEVTN